MFWPRAYRESERHGGRPVQGDGVGERFRLRTFEIDACAIERVLCFNAVHDFWQCLFGRIRRVLLADEYHDVAGSERHVGAREIDCVHFSGLDGPARRKRRVEIQGMDRSHVYVGSRSAEPDAQAEHHQLAVVDGQFLRAQLPRSNVVPFHPCRDRFRGFKRLRQLVLAGHALNAHSGWHDCGGGRTDCFVDVEGQMHRSRNTRIQLIADETSQFEDRSPLDCGAQIALVGDALLIERQDIAHDGPGIEQGNRRVVEVAGCQASERMAQNVRCILDVFARQLLEHARQDVAVRCDAVGQRGRTRRVVEWLRRQARLAAVAVARVVRRGDH